MKTWICGICAKEKKLSEFWKDGSNKITGRQRACKECQKKRFYQWRKNNPERNREIDRRYRHRHAVARKVASRKYYRANAERLRAKELERRKLLKKAAYAAYGGYKCACCGETGESFLCLDHVNEDGAAHRKLVDPARLYYWLRANGYPKGFQVLCFNCNQSKRLNKGTCAHKL